MIHNNPNQNRIKKFSWQTVDSIWRRQSLARKVSFYVVGSVGALLLAVLCYFIGQRAQPHDIGVVIAFAVVELCFLILWPMATLRWNGHQNGHQKC